MRLMALLVLCLAGCGAVGPVIQGSGKVTDDPRQVDQFTAVSFSSGNDLQVEFGAPGHSCTVKCDDNLQEYVETKVEDGELKIRLRDNVSLSPSQPIKVSVSAPKLTAIVLANSSNTQITGLQPADSLTITAAGSHDLTCSGQLESLSFKLAGSGKLVARELVSKNVELEIAGSGAAEVNASENLKVKVVGSGSVQYMGEAKVTQSIVGAGTVQKIEP